MATEAELKASGEFWDPGYQAFIASGFAHPSWSEEAQKEASARFARMTGVAVRSEQTKWGEGKSFDASGREVSTSPAWVSYANWFDQVYAPWRAGGGMSVNTQPRDEQETVRLVPTQTGGTSTPTTVYAPPEEGEYEDAGGGFSRRNMIFLVLIALVVIGAVVLARRGKVKRA